MVGRGDSLLAKLQSRTRESAGEKERLKMFGAVVAREQSGRRRLGRELRLLKVRRDPLKVEKIGRRAGKDRKKTLKDDNLCIYGRWG